MHARSESFLASNPLRTPQALTGCVGNSPRALILKLGAVDHQRHRRLTFRVAPIQTPSLAPFHLFFSLCLSTSANLSLGVVGGSPKSSPSIGAHPTGEACVVYTNPPVWYMCDINYWFQCGLRPAHSTALGIIAPCQLVWSRLGYMSPLSSNQPLNFTSRRLYCEPSTCVTLAVPRPRKRSP